MSWLIFCLYFRYVFHVIVKLNDCKAQKITKADITSECGFAAFCCNHRDYNSDVASNCFAKSGKASTGQQNKP